MSEKILKALMQLFAIVVKQNGNDVKEEERAYVRSFLRDRVGEEGLESYMSLFEKRIKTKKKKDSVTVTQTAVGDSVKTLGIAKKINKTLSQKQKTVVLVRLY